MKTYSQQLQHPKWQKKRLEILKRDKFRCKMCSDKETQLQIHHLKYSGKPWEAKNEDLISLCSQCHMIVEHYKKWNHEIIKCCKIEGTSRMYCKSKENYFAVVFDKERKKILSDLFIYPDQIKFALKKLG